MRVVLATGGTGGHIYPALALAKEIEKDPSAEILFMGTLDRMEATLLPEKGYDYFGLDVEGVIGGRRTILDKVKALNKLRLAKGVAKDKIKEYQPDIVVGFGNYLTVPVIQAAKELHIPTIIHEQNSAVGKANLLLSKICDRIITSYENPEFPQGKTIQLGNPRATEAATIEKNPKVLEEFGLDSKKDTVLIVMGSLGAGTINQIMTDTLKELKDESFQVIYVTGKDWYDDIVGQVEVGENEVIVPYVDQLNVMANCALVVSRAGATSCAEIAAMGIPSILIPSPFVTNNHQHFNALAMVEKGCAIELEEDGLTSQKLANEICRLMKDQSIRDTMHENAKTIGFPHAAEDFVSEMKKMIKERI